MSQLQYRNENQNFISNFVFQFIKKNEMAPQIHRLNSVSEVLSEDVRLE